MLKRAWDVMIAGEVNLDLILYGLPSYMPEERELLASGFVTTLGGSSSILAHNLAVLGTKVCFAGLVGRDELGKIALDRLAASGVDVTHVAFHADLSTGITLLLPHGQSRHILTYAGSMASLTTADLSAEFLQSGRHFHISSLFLQEGMQSGLPDVVRQLKSTGVTFSLDTNDDPNDRWGGVLDQLLDLADVFLPNEDELLRITKQDSLDEALSVLGDRVPITVVKCGSRGAVLQQHGCREIVPGITVVPVDTIGAGDSFDAGFLCAWLRGQPASAAARFGNVTGALSTQRSGGTEAFRDASLVRTFLARHTDEAVPAKS